MALKVTVSTGKPQTSRPAGLVPRGEGDHAAAAAGQVSVNDLVQTLFSEVRASIEKEADVEVEFTANVEIITKDGQQTVNLDLSGESPNARTMRLKFTTKINPQEQAKG